MSSPKLPKLLKELHAAIRAGDLTKALPLAAQAEEEWECIADALQTLHDELQSSAGKADSIAEGAW